MKWKRRKKKINRTYIFICRNYLVFSIYILVPYIESRPWVCTLNIVHLQALAMINYLLLFRLFFLIVMEQFDRLRYFLFFFLRWKRKKKKKQKILHYCENQDTTKKVLEISMNLSWFNITWLVQVTRTNPQPLLTIQMTPFS